jgi:hypothetical protein
MQFLTKFYINIVSISLVNFSEELHITSTANLSADIEFNIGTNGLVRGLSCLSEVLGSAQNRI